MYEQSHRDYLALVICIIVCLSCGLLIITVITPLPKTQRDKNARELKLANAAITDMQMRQRGGAALDAKYTKELADAKAENDALRDDVYAGRRQFCTSKQSVSQCVKPPPLRRGGCLYPRLADTAEPGLFHPQREADHYAKTTGRNPEVY